MSTFKIVDCENHMELHSAECADVAKKFAKHKIGEYPESITFESWQECESAFHEDTDDAWILWFKVLPCAKQVK